MKTLTNLEEFVAIYKNEKAFKEASTNMEMRFYINSYNFKSTRELAEKLMAMRDEQAGQ